MKVIIKKILNNNILEKDIKEINIQLQMTGKMKENTKKEQVNKQNEKKEENESNIEIKKMEIKFRK